MNNREQAEELLARESKCGYMEYDEAEKCIRALCDELDQKNKQLSGLEEDCYELKAKLEAAKEVIDAAGDACEIVDIEQGDLARLESALANYKECGNE